ncbi:hypothetical protein [Amycolatopsis suaedae]|uniref:hypothetical protein n=1 Tax=Amycolatopsis suaedae TaxID=2510978 RepID=UPI00196A7834|nr:hypothetical protein [Amycolatopsis suaedae]
MNRIRAVTAALLAVLTVGVLAPPATAADPVQRCVTTLACTAEDIDGLSMAQRLALVRGLSSGPAAELVRGNPNRWRNIEGIITFFRDREMGMPGTWVSYVDAGIVEGIERGIAIALGRGEETFGNPGAPLWAAYLTGLRDGTLPGRAAHDRAWSLAEQASTEHGVRLAEQVHGIAPTGVEQRFFAFSEFYRLTLRSRPALLDVVSSDPADPRQVTFLDWFTDVTNSVPSYRGAELAFDLAEFNLPAGTVRTVALGHAYLRHLFPAYLADLAGAETADFGQNW